jgi:hypothetical protein
MLTILLRELSERSSKFSESMFLHYNDVILRRLEKKDIDILKNSYEIINPILYYFNRSFNTRVKGVPIEIYLGIEGMNLPMFNKIKYPEFQVGQCVYALARGCYKSLEFRKKKIMKDIFGQIIARPTKSVYTIKTDLEPPNDEMNWKWYEFIPITKEEFDKLKKMPLFK